VIGWKEMDLVTQKDRTARTRSQGSARGIRPAIARAIFAHHPPPEGCDRVVLLNGAPPVPATTARQARESITPSTFPSSARLVNDYAPDAGPGRRPRWRGTLGRFRSRQSSQLEGSASGQGSAVPFWNPSPRRTAARHLNIKKRSLVEFGRHNHPPTTLCKFKKWRKL